MKFPTILVATLGSEPQIITLTLDLLLQQGQPVDRVVVLHTDPSFEPIQASLSILHAEFQHHYPEVIFSPQVMRDADGLLLDVVTDAQCEAMLEACYQTLRHYKMQGAHLHLCLSGGRKTMSLLAFACAQLLFDPSDQVWLLYSDETLTASRRLHPTADDLATLIPMPLTLWNSVPAVLRPLDAHAQQTLQTVRQTQTQHQRELEQAFRKNLSRAEVEVLDLLLETGLDNKGLAQRLGKGTRTVGTQLASIYDKFKLVYDMPDVTRAQLMAVLGNPAKMS